MTRRILYVTIESLESGRTSTRENIVESVRYEVSFLFLGSLLTVELPGMSKRPENVCVLGGSAVHIPKKKKGIES